MKKCKKLFVLALVLLMTISTACQTQPINTGSSASESQGSESAGTSDSSEGTAASTAESEAPQVSPASVPEGVIPYTPYDLSGQSITIYTAEGELSNSVLAQKDRFTELTGCEVVMIAIPMATFKEKLSVDLASGSNEYDAMAMTVEKEFIDNGWVEPLTSYFNDPSIADPNLNLDDFISSQIEVMTDNGVIYGLPWKPDVMVYYYRKDLFDDEANKAAFNEQFGYDLAPAKTWEEYFDIAKFFTKDDGSLYGSLFMGMNVNQLTNCFQTRFFGTGLYWYDDNYVSQANTPEFKNALESFKWELENTAPPGTDNWEWPEANTAFLSGIVAQHVTWPGLSKMVETPEGDWGKSEVVGKVGWTTPPGWADGSPATLMGGWWAYVSAFSDNKVAAYKFIEFMTSQEGELLKVPSGCDPARQSNFDLLAKDDPFLKVFSDSLAISKPIPKLPRWSAFEIQFRDAAHAGITGQISIDEAAARIDKELNQFLIDEGHQK